MIRSMMALASGMKAQQLNVDTIANNLANVNTTGFKRSQVLFQDMLYETVRPQGNGQSGSLTAPAGGQVGLGVNMVSIAKNYSAGQIQVTNDQMQVAINGDGFFQLKAPNGQLYYSRDGAFTRNATGNVVNADGYQLEGIDSIDPNATAVVIDSAGNVSQTVNGQTTQKGTIPLYRFINPQGLQSVGKNLAQATTASGEAQSGTAGVDGLGTIQQGALETSNVQVVDEMVNLIMAQRAYEMNAKAMQASDEMMQASNNLKR